MGDNTPAPSEHGGHLAEAKRRFPGAPEPFIDLSTGINPVAYPIPALPPDAWARLPEPGDLIALQTAAAHAYGAADPAMVVAAPGSQILISLLPILLGRDRALILGPTYNEHLAAWRRHGAATEVPSLDLLDPAGVAIVCNPNNPDGRHHTPATLVALADRCAAAGGLLVVDEAFADFAPECSLAPALPHPAVLILRSLGKAYGLAGLRLGFALAASPLAEHLRTALGPWAVSGPAIRIGQAALADAEWRQSAQRRLAADQARLDALLRTAGFDIRGGTPLFRLAEHPEAQSWFGRLGQAGLLVRRFAAHPTWLRRGLPAPQNRRRVPAVMHP